MKGKQTPILLITLLLIMSAMGIVAQDEEPSLQPGLAMNILDRVLPMFSETSFSSERVAEIEPGMIVDILQIEPDWAQIEYQGEVGWIKYATPDMNFLVNVSGLIPLARGYHQMVYDSESNRTILHGGISSNQAELNTTWSYEAETNTWVRMNPPELPEAGEGPLAYDAQSDRVVHFYGSNKSFTNTESETWAYDYNSDTWTNMEPSTAPPPLLGARMVYDVESDRMILFGGIYVPSVLTRADYRNETWAYDFDTNTWTKMNPELSPPGVTYHPMAYDASSDRVILISSLVGEEVPGARTRELSDDTWVYDFNTDTWELRETPERPGFRDYGAMVYVDSLEQVILFGAGEPSVNNDTWTYDFDSNTWTRLHPEPVPSKRGWHAMAYDHNADRIVLFGGGASRDAYTLETWTYDPIGNIWEAVGP